MNTFQVTHIPHFSTYIAELARKSCSKINYSIMPMIGGEGDTLITPREVPLAIRRAAKAALLG